MRTSLQILIIVAIAVLAAACSHDKKPKQKAIVKPQLEKEIVGSWTTEGTSEQIDDYLMAGYGQQLALNADKTFQMAVVMSVTGVLPYESAALPVTATFGAEISGTYTVAGDTLSLAYNAETVRADMSPDDVVVDTSDYPEYADAGVIRQALIERLESIGMSASMLEESLREAVHGQTDRFTKVSVSGDRLQMSLDGSPVVYIRD